MKIIKFTPIFIFALIIISLPMMTHAATKNTVKPKAPALFCTRITTVKEKAAGDIARIGQKALSQNDALLSNLKKEWAATDAKQKDARATSDAARLADQTKSVAALSANTKAARDIFNASVEQSILDRRMQTDAVVATYRAGVISLITARKEKIQNAITAYTSSVNAAVTESKAACSKQGNQTIKSTFDTTVATHTTAFKNAYQDITETKKSVAALAKKERADIAIINQKAEAALLAAKTTFTKSVKGLK